MQKPFTPIQKAFIVLVVVAFGALAGGIIGLILALPVAGIFVTTPADSLESAIWMAVGGFWGTIIGFAATFIVALFRVTARN